jgi:mannosyl-glycoprotein endo-beta-N-acetylglucosaminidase
MTGACELAVYTPKGFNWIKNTPAFVPAAGDVAVWNAMVVGGYGHVAIVVAANETRLCCFEQNWPTVLFPDPAGAGLSPCHLVEHEYTNVAGFLRRA